jgi:hypothetical protein
MVGLLNYELDRVSKQAVMVVTEVLSQYVPGGVEEIMKTSVTRVGVPPTIQIQLSLKYRMYHIRHNTKIIHV